MLSGKWQRIDPLLSDSALVHDGDLMTEKDRFGDIVRYEKNRPGAMAPKLQQQLVEPIAKDVVQGSKWFIQQ
jgi:hypothetical protein